MSEKDISTKVQGSTSSDFFICLANTKIDVPLTMSEKIEKQKVFEMLQTRLTEKNKFLVQTDLPTTITWIE